MIALLCALASGLLFYVSTGLGEVWPLAWLAPLPVLWLAYGGARAWKVATAAFAAYALGQLSLFEAYGILGLMLAVLIALTAAAFTASVMAGRWMTRRLPAWAGALAFPCVWVAWEYLFSLISPNGSFGALAYSQVGGPALIQSASLFGLWSISFLICSVASLTALALGRPAQRLGLLVLAGVMFAANLGFGLWRLAQPQAAAIPVAAVADDRIGVSWDADRPHALAATTQYAAHARALASRAAFIVLPEKFTFLRPQWRDEALAPLQRVADETGATVVAGFDDLASPRINAALVLRPRQPLYAYAKRHFVPGLEINYAAGTHAGLFAPRLATAICKDMDFERTMRGDAKNHIGLMLAPAWDFDRDGWSHARMAVLRGVEGGYAVVRSAQHGLATVSDAQGRVLARTSSAGGEAAVASVAPGPGDTLYVRIGDVFAWLCIAGALILAIASVLRRPLALTSPRSSV